MLRRGIAIATLPGEGYQEFAMQLLQYEKLTDDLLADFVGRDATVWFTNEVAAPAEIECVAAPWRAVLLEHIAKDGARRLEERTGEDQWTPLRGYLHVVAMDPTALRLPRRSQPVYLLHGNPNSSIDVESALLTSRAAQRRRWNMIAQAGSLQPRRIFVVGDHTELVVDDLVDLWQQGCRSHLTLVTTCEDSARAVLRAYETNTDLAAISWLRLDAPSFAAAVVARARELLATEGLLLKVRLEDGGVLDVDVLGAELSEQPIRDVCEFVQVRDLLSLSPEDLAAEEVKGFFVKEAATWRPYAAGLPWPPDSGLRSQVVEALKRTLNNGPGQPEVLSIVCASGAGGTTLARWLAFEAAQEGFISVLAKPRLDAPSALELTSFMYRSVEIIKQNLRGSNRSVDGEPAWLLVLDVDHFDRRQQALWRYLADITRSGRKVVVLKICDARDPLQPPQEIEHTELGQLDHELDLAAVQDLGSHLNRFLKPHGWDKPPEAWTAFWDRHRPDLDVGIASFWVALEFWLRGYLDMGASIQQWLLAQFKDADVTSDVKAAMLEIAAFSIERRAIPEKLLPLLEHPRVPWRDALDEIRATAPALALVGARTPSLGHAWAMAHDTLARYLVNGVFGDMLFAKSLGLADMPDAVALRLELLGRTCRRSAIASPDVRDFVITLATTTLKLDEQHGNPELFPHWKRVLEVLDAVPKEVREQSRFFNHHLAISRRRIIYGDVFQASAEDKLRLLKRAEAEVRFALERIVPTPDDESDLNLFNTLALIYQDMATLERSTTNNKEHIASLLNKSDQATHRALAESPSNSYVLETAARNLIRRAPDQSPLVRVREAAEALAFVSQAFLLDTAVLRRESLGRLAEEALNFLAAPDASREIDRLCQEGNPFGYMARAWLFIARSSPTLSLPEAIETLSTSTAQEAIEILAGSVDREWPLVRFLLQLHAVAHPLDFKEEILLVEELASFPGFRLPLQQRVERAVLLHQVGRHKEGNAEFGEIRKAARSSGQILFLPSRLRWLLAPNTTRRLVCTATAQDRGTGRAMAEVREMAGALVPLRVQEFGKEQMAPGERFRCWITFSPMGPFLKPPETSLGEH